MSLKSKFSYFIELKKTPSNLKPIQVTSPADVEQYLRNIWHSDIGIRERFYALYLNNSNYIIGYSEIGSGGVAGVMADVRLIMSPAVQMLCTGVIISHNHPSGKLLPSDNDVKLTKRVNRACEVLDITLLDHIILTEESYYTFSQNGLLS